MTIRFMFKLLGGISFTEITKCMQCPQQCISLTIAHVPYFATFASGGGLVRPPWRSAPGFRRPSRKKQSMRLDGISRMHILFLVLGQHLISLDQVKGQIFAKIDIFALHAHSGVNMRRSDLKPSPACSLFNLDKIECCYSIPLQHLAYIVP